MSEIREDLPVEELAALIGSALERHGVRVVLSGGSVVSIYADNACLGRIERWSRQERSEQKFQEFAARLRDRRRRPPA